MRPGVVSAAHVSMSALPQAQEKTRWKTRALRGALKQSRARFKLVDSNESRNSAASYACWSCSARRAEPRTTKRRRHPAAEVLRLGAQGEPASPRPGALPAQEAPAAGTGASGSGGNAVDPPDAAAGNTSGGGSADADNGDSSSDASSDAMGTGGGPVCLGAGNACSADGGATCCEAYVCRLGRCCVPNGIRSWCTKSSDCCSTSCVLNQCTCVPLGYSCSGPGQCCSGFECRSGTCICPPDIRGCN